MKEQELKKTNTYNIEILLMKKDESKGNSYITASGK